MNAHKASFLACALGALVLAACSDSNPPPPPPPVTPPPLPQPVSGWSITHWGAGGVAQAAQPLAAPVFALPNCASASTCWISYVEMSSGSLAGKSALVLSYTLAGDSPLFVHDSPNNTCGPPDGGTLRLILHMAGDSGQSYGRWFSQPPTELGLGSFTVTVPLTVENWIDVNGQSTDTGGFNTAVANAGSIGLGLGGGCFAAHGVAVAAGSATISVQSYSAQ